MFIYDNVGEIYKKKYVTYPACAMLVQVKFSNRKDGISIQVYMAIFCAND